MQSALSKFTGRHRPIVTLVAVFGLFVAGQSRAEPTQAQPKLPTVSLTLADKTLATEVADEPAEMETGMMFRKKMADGDAMLFILGQPQHAAFWMRNTLIPLSVAYLNAAGMILEIHDLQPRDERPVESHFDTIAYAIEVPQGWFTRNGILPGVTVGGLPPAPAGH